MSNFSRWSDDGLWFRCPECGGEFSIGHKMAVFWTCDHCRARVDVKYDDKDDEAIEAAIAAKYPQS